MKFLPPLIRIAEAIRDGKEDPRKRRTIKERKKKKGGINEPINQEKPDCPPPGQGYQPKRVGEELNYDEIAWPEEESVCENCSCIKIKFNEDEEMLYVSKGEKNIFTGNIWDFEAEPEFLKDFLEKCGLNVKIK